MRLARELSSHAAVLKCPKVTECDPSNHFFGEFLWPMDTCLGLAILQNRVRHIIPVTHSELVRMRRAHPVAAVVEERSLRFQRIRLDF